MITIADLRHFWGEDLDDDADTIAMILRIRREEFSEDVPFHIAEAMKAWATADSGPTACYFADKVKSGLSYLRTGETVRVLEMVRTPPTLFAIDGGLSSI